MIQKTWKQKTKNKESTERKKTSFPKNNIENAGLQSVTKYLRLTLVFMWNSVLQKKFNCHFLEVFYEY